MRIENLEPCFMEYIPEILEEGKLYISQEFCTAAHLCACGCKGKVFTPLGQNKWHLTQEEKEVSLTPSIGNWSGENPYHAHYFITRNKICWC